MMMLLLLLILPIIFIYLLRKNTMTTLLPPGPPRLPLIGNLHQLVSAEILYVYLWQLAKKYGPIIHMKLGSVPVLVVSSAKLAKEVLQTQDLTFCSRPKLLGQQKLSYNSLDIALSPYNNTWKEVRKIAVIHLLNLKKIQSFRPIREDEISRMIAKIACVASSSDKVVNLSEMSMALSSILICRIAFGKRYEGSQMKRFDELLQDAEVTFSAFFVSDYFPLLSWVDKLTGSINKAKKTYKKLDSFYQELIDEHLDPRRAKNMEEADDFLDILIQLKLQNSCSFDLSWDRIKALLMDVFVAATETSAASVVWTMTALMKTPDVMEKVKAEITRNLIGGKGYLDEDDLQKLPYLKAVINEAFRLYPSAPLLVPRETTQKCTLNGYEIQPKSLVFINAWAIGRDPEYWQNPDQFLPERFLNSNIDVKGQDFGVIPFGSGRRICPGMHMGLSQVELTIANLVYSFDWELPPGVKAEDVDTDSLPGLAAHKKNPLLLVPKIKI